jgi:hypothetical protein
MTASFTPFRIAGAVELTRDNAGIVKNDVDRQEDPSLRSGWQRGPVKHPRQIVACRLPPADF